MRKSRLFTTTISLLVLIAIVLNLTGCLSSYQSTDTKQETNSNSEQTEENKVQIDRPILENVSEDVLITDFALRLFYTANQNEENTLISPISVLCALAMLANGAENETLAQIEDMIGINREELNLYLNSYISSLPQGEAFKLGSANSIWYTDSKDFTINQDFLKTNDEYFNAESYKTSFYNQNTVDEINSWVNEKTEGTISEIIKEIPDDVIMYLINALFFEAEWVSKYDEYSVHNGEFTKENGEKQNTELMYSTEQVYLELDNATGFIKYYKGAYAFVALLPNEGISVEECLYNLDGAELNEILTNPKYTTVRTSLPKFETEFYMEMNDILKTMGMTDAFDISRSDFDSLGSLSTGNVFVNKAIHKTYIQVGESGTKAGAVTSLEINGGSSEPTDIKEVYLNRPFVYMLIDTENKIPFFIGTMMEIN